MACWPGTMRIPRSDRPAGATLTEPEKQDDLLRAIAAVGGYVEFGSQNADIHLACVYRERPFGIVRHFHVDFAFDVYFALLLFEYDGVDQP